MQALGTLLALMLLAAPAAGAEVPVQAATLHRLAVEGDADAQYALGLFFLKKMRDPARAAPWLEKAAEQDHAHAAMELGFLLANEDKPHAPALAVRWIARAAEAGLAEAISEFGIFHFEGFGPLDPDCSEALRWLELGVLKKNVSARNNLAWVLSTCPDSEYRNGRRALRLGLRLVYGDGLYTPGALDTLAAAFAEAGDFLSAVEVQEEALDLLEPESEERSDFEQRLREYRERQPWRGPGHPHEER